MLEHRKTAPMSHAKQFPAGGYWHKRPRSCDVLEPDSRRQLQGRVGSQRIGSLHYTNCISNSKPQGLPEMAVPAVKSLLSQVADGAAFESLVFGELPPLTYA